MFSKKLPRLLISGCLCIIPNVVVVFLYWCPQFQKIDSKLPSIKILQSRLSINVYIYMMDINTTHTFLSLFQIYVGCG